MHKLSVFSFQFSPLITLRVLEPAFARFVCKPVSTHSLNRSFQLSAFSFQLSPLITLRVLEPATLGIVKVNFSSLVTPLIVRSLTTKVKTSFTFVRLIEKFA